MLDRRSEPACADLEELDPALALFAVCDLDRDGRCVATNAAWRALIEAEGLGDGWLAQLHDDDRAALRARCAAAAAPGVFDLRLRTPRGAWIDLRVAISARREGRAPSNRQVRSVMTIG